MKIKNTKKKQQKKLARHEVSLFHTTQANKKKPLIIQTLPTLVLKPHLNSNIYNK